MIRDNLERDNVSATASSSVISKDCDDSDGEDQASISEAERNRLLIEKMSQGQPERKKSYSASEQFTAYVMAVRNFVFVFLSIALCIFLYFSLCFSL